MVLCAKRKVHAVLIRRFFRNRREPIRAPVDLVPPQMQDVHVELLRDGRFYSLTFRKP
jgi:hypothetical protein